MTGPPDSPTPGYMWICHAAMPSATVRALERQLVGTRHDLRSRHLVGIDHPSLDTDVELWIDPEDWTRVGPAVMALVAKM